jgi:hypothetical protein
VVGEELSRGFHRPLAVTCRRQPFVYEEIKIRALLPPADIAGAAARVRSNVHYITFS